MKVRSIASAVPAGLLVLTLAACGDDGDDGATDDTTTTAAAADESTTTAAPDTETTGSAADPGDAVGDIDLTGLLLTAADVGPEFTEVAYETTTGAGPCGVDIDAENPYEDIVGSRAVDEARGLGFQHEIRLYADEAAAETTFAAAQDALDCPGTNDDGQTIDAPADVSADVDAPGFAVFIDDADGVGGGLVTVLVGPVISVYQYQGQGDIAPEELPDTQTIVSTNVAAIQAALG